jgi:hypothetical protein
MWLPEAHELLIPYLEARIAKWSVDALESDVNTELHDRLARAEAEVAAVREALKAL